MRVKIGDVWYQAEPSQPIMLELTELDREMVSNMHPEATKLAYFDDDDGLTAEERRAWMNDQ